MYIYMYIYIGSLYLPISLVALVVSLCFGGPTSSSRCLSPASRLPSRPPGVQTPEKSKPQTPNPKP